MNKRTRRKLSIDEQILDAMRGRLAPVGAIALARELETPWRIVARSLLRLAEAGRVIEQPERVAVPYRHGGETRRRYSVRIESVYPEWLMPARRVA